MNSRGVLVTITGKSRSRTGLSVTGVTSSFLPAGHIMPQTTPYAGKFSPNPYSNTSTHYVPVETVYGGLCYHDNSLVSGSLEALIQHLVPTVDYFPDVSVGDCPF